MNKERFAAKLGEKLQNTPEHLTDDQIKEILYLRNKNSESYEGDPALIPTITIEEMSELLQVLSKIRRGLLPRNAIELYEEIVDVWICIYDLYVYVFKINDQMRVPSIEKLKDKVPKSFDPALAIMQHVGLATMGLVHCINAKVTSGDMVELYIATLEDSIYDLILAYDLDVDKLLYVYDIKLERVYERACM